MDQIGLLRLSVIWLLGTAGIYGGLYGFAVAERVFVVLGIALTVLAVTGGVVTAVQESWWWRRRRLHRAAATPPPEPRRLPDELDGPVIAEDELTELSDTAPRRVRPLEAEPTYLVARYLFPTERYRGEWLRHWIRPVVRYALTLGVAVAGEILVRRYVPDEYLPAARAGVAVLGGLIGLHVLFAWQKNRFVLTNKRVMVVEGLIRRRVSMAPLLRVTDLRYEQSALGRLLNYGGFVIEGIGFFSRIRRIPTLPNPNELYLRIVEEIYEPLAVEARLGRDESLTVAVREAIYGPALANYDGWVSLGLIDADETWVTVDEDRTVALEPGRDYRLDVIIADRPASDVAEPLVVNGGVDREVVVFTAEVDSDRRDLRQPARTIEAGRTGGSVSFSIRTPVDGFLDESWLWVRISQQSRLLQSVELIASVAQETA